jgi:transcriptional regulator with XRE-family HTH domain
MATALIVISRGRRSLLAVLRYTTEREVAARVGVSRPAVSYWASGYKRPSPAARAKLQALYGIGAAGWDAAVAASPLAAE